MRRLRKLWDGKFHIWCLTHGHRFRLVGLVLVLLGLFLLAGYFDWQDLHGKAERYRKRVEMLQREKEVANQLPKTVFIIEAATPDELMVKMARIAGDLDVQRDAIRKSK